MAKKEVKARPLPIELLTLDPDLQSRAQKLDDDGIERYTEMWRETTDANPFGSTLVKVFQDGGTYYVAGGFHRVVSAEAAGRSSVLCDVEDGTWQDAWDYSFFESNLNHGIPLTTADKRFRVIQTLKNEKYSGLSDSLIAQKLGVSDKTVAARRRELVSASEIPKLDVREAADGKKRSAARPASELTNDEGEIEEELEEEYEEYDPVQDSDQVPDLPVLSAEANEVREVLLEHFNADELPTEEAHYKAIRQGPKASWIDVVENARECAKGNPKLQDFRKARKEADWKYRKSLVNSHAEEAMQQLDELHALNPNDELHVVAMEQIQSFIRSIGEWA